jgi:hypothetical protein
VSVIIRLAVIVAGCTLILMAMFGAPKIEITPAHAVTAVFFVGGLILLAVAALKP